MNEILLDGFLKIETNTPENFWLYVLTNGVDEPYIGYKLADKWYRLRAYISATSNTNDRHVVKADYIQIDTPNYYQPLYPLKVNVPLFIRVTKRSDDYHVSLSSDSRMWEAAKTPEQGIAAFRRSHPEYRSLQAIQTFPNEINP